MVETFQFGFPGETKTTIVDITVRPDGRLILVGTLPGTEVPKGVRRAHALGEPVPGATHAFVAQLSADGQTVQWISRLGGEIITPTSY